jgi:hypothetical protein
MMIFKGRKNVRMVETWDAMVQKTTIMVLAGATRRNLRPTARNQRMIVRVCFNLSTMAVRKCVWLNCRGV